MGDRARNHHYLANFSWDQQIISKSYWQAIKKAKERFFTDSNLNIPDPIVRPEIAESWIRAKKRGLTPQSDFTSLSLDAHALQDKWTQNRTLCEVSSALISSFDALAKSSGYSLELFDLNGGHLLGSHLEMIERDPFLRAMDWREEKSGTMAHFLSLEYKKPFCLIGPEMLLDVFHDVISISAPILDDEDKAIGVLLLVQQLGENPWEQVNLPFHRHSLGWVCSLATAIEGQVSLLKKNEDLRTSSELLRATLESIGEAVLTILPNGMITNTNLEGRYMLNIRDESNMRYLQDFLPQNSTLMKTIASGEKHNYFEQSLLFNQKEVPYFINIQPIYDRTKKAINSYVLRFTPQKSINELIARQSGSKAVYSFEDIIGQDERVLAVKEQAKHFALTDENILLLGNSGTGKELFAQAIHNYYNPSGPFIALNCSAIPRELIESELFGYEGGAFTGAEKTGRMGKIELAHGGTLFLDEIGSMPYDMQTVLLRVLQDKHIMRVGGKQYRKVNFRLIAAMSSDFEEQIWNKTFREDLFFRLSVLYIEIPSLAARGQDVLLLANYFIKKYAVKAKWPIPPSLSKEAEQEILSYTWPGNVRQLQNAMIYAMNMASGNVIEKKHLPKRTLVQAPMKMKESNVNVSPRQQLYLEESEKKLILTALNKADNQTKYAAELLGLSYSSLYRRLKKYNIKI